MEWNESKGIVTLETSQTGVGNDAEERVYHMWTFAAPFNFYHLK